MNSAYVCITKVIYKNPVTVVFWSDNTKTYSKINKGSSDKYTFLQGFTLCCLKKLVSPKTLRQLLHQWVDPCGDEDVETVLKYLESGEVEVKTFDNR